MKSPFPGMDPYIEASGLWEYFHSHLIEKIYEFVALAVPRGYTVETGYRSYVVLMTPNGKAEHLAKPDVVVAGSGSKKPGRRKGGAALAVATETDGSLPIRSVIAEQFREKFVDIYYEGEERALVTCLEVLSPSNKRAGSEGQIEYLRKRQAMLLGSVNFLELDLLRGGERMPMVEPWPDSPYTLLLSRMAGSGYCRVWPAFFQQRLPPFPVPLTADDGDLTLDLQPLIDRVYAVGRYEERIDYSRRLRPKLSPADAAWVKEQLKSR